MLSPGKNNPSDEEKPYSSNRRPRTVTWSNDEMVVGRISSSASVESDVPVYVSKRDGQLNNLGVFIKQTISGETGDSTVKFKDVRDEEVKGDEDDEEDYTQFEDLIPFIGDFGFYQQLLFLMMIPFGMYIAFVYFAQMFITLTPEHWCLVPELENYTEAQRIMLAIPKNEEGVHSKCFEYDVNWATMEVIPDAPLPTWTTRKCSRGWEFSFADIPYVTITSELGWVCDRDRYPAYAQACFFCGAICGGLVFGWVADKYGRIPALVGTNMMGFVGGMATIFCTNFVEFCICRFLVGFAFDNCFTMMYILVLEYVGPKWRTFVANMSLALFFTLGSCLVPWIAWVTRDWRLCAIATSSPLLLSVLTPLVVPESVRWLVSQGKIERAIKILRRFEKINKIKIPETVLKDFGASALKIKEIEDSSGVTYSVAELYKTPRLRRHTLLLIVIWMIISIAFDGHVRNVGALGLDVFLTFTIAAFTELPADTFLTIVLDRWGRRWLSCGSLVFSGLFSISATFVPLGIPTASLAILGRFSVNVSYNIGLQYAAELLPTVVRAQGVAFIHIMGYVASIFAPFIVYLVNVHQSLPLLVLGTLSIIGGIVSLFLPETMDKELPQTLSDGENFGTDQKFWDCPACRKKEVVIHHDPAGYLTRMSVFSSKPSMADIHVRKSEALLGGPVSRATVRASCRASMARPYLQIARTK